MPELCVPPAVILPFPGAAPMEREKLPLEVRFAAVRFRVSVLFSKPKACPLAETAQLIAFTA